MSRKIGDETKVKSKSRVGTFFFGTFIGFLMCIATLFGVGAFVYFKVSPNWINSTFKTNVNLGNDELNKKTLKDFVTSGINLVNNYETYTLNHLKQDFGIEIGDTLMKIDISDLKDVELSDLKQAVTDRISNISAHELDEAGLMDMESIDNILTEVQTYYFNNNELYEDQAHQTKVSFSYKIENNNIKVGGGTVPIAVDRADVQLKYLPISSALSTFMSSFGDRITIKELRDEYHVTLPSYFSKMENATINELTTELNKLYIADFLGYTVDDSDPDNLKVMNGTKQVTGIIGVFGVETLESVKNIQTKIKSKTIASLLDYKIEGGKVYDGNTELTGVMAIVAKSTIGSLQKTIEDLTVADVVENTTGALSLIPASTPIKNVSSAVTEKIKAVKIDELITKNVIAEPEGYQDVKDIKIGGTEFKNCTINQLLEGYIDYLQTIS